MKYRLNSLFLKCLGGKPMKELQLPKMNNIFKCVQNAFKLHCLSRLLLLWWLLQYYYLLSVFLVKTNVLDWFTHYVLLNLTHLWVLNMLIYVTGSIAVFKNTVGIIIFFWWIRKFLFFLKVILIYLDCSSNEILKGKYSLISFNLGYILKMIVLKYIFFTQLETLNL